MMKSFQIWNVQYAWLSFFTSWLVAPGLMETVMENSRGSLVLELLLQ